MNFLSTAKFTSPPSKLKAACKAMNKGDLTLVQNWIPLLKVIRLLGDAPIQIKPTDVQSVAVLESPSVANSSNKAFEFKTRWIYPGSICILVFAAIRTLSTLAQYHSTILPSWSYSAPANRTNLSETEQLIKSFRMYTVPILNWLQWIYLLVYFSDFVRFLNNWQVFNEKICDWSTLGDDIQEFGSLAWVVLRAFMLTNGSMLLRIAYTCTTTGYTSNTIVFTLAVGIVNQQVAFIEDLKVIFMHRSIATGYSKVRFRVLEPIKNCGSCGSHVLSEKSNVRCIIKSYHELHKILKEQVRLSESCQGWHEISYLCYLVMVATFSIFLTLSPIFRGETPRTLELSFNCIHLMAGMIRLYLKCEYAEDITKQEKLLADALYSSQLWDYPEAKMFADSIVWNPIKVVYGSVITMDKRLMLKIGGQIIAYIIILLQFQLSFVANQP